MSLLGAIIAGGESTRMGRDKASVDVGGTSMLERVSRALRAAVDRVVVLGPDREGYQTWPDQVEAGGPLAGLVTALERMKETRVLLVAVDQPFVSASTLSRLAAVPSSLPVVPVDEVGVPQVTCAVYPADLAPIAREEAEAGGSIQSLLDRVSFTPVPPSQWRGWGEDGRSWFSVNTPGDVEAGLARFSA